MNIDRNEIVRLTEEYGRAWGIQHTRRLLKFIELIGEGLVYNSEAVWLAAHLHDWGAYAPWAQKDVEHVLRSRQVVEPFLVERGCPQDLSALVLECIELHHSSGSTQSLESILLRDADGLDFLGVVGVLRNFSINPRDLRRGFEETIRRRDKILGVLSLEKSKAIAAVRVKQMDELLGLLETDSSGLF